jgi:hypothetical protein
MQARAQVVRKQIFFDFVQQHHCVVGYSLHYVISNKMDPESKQLWARRIASADEPIYEMLITFLEERQFATATTAK